MFTSVIILIVTQCCLASELVYNEYHYEYLHQPLECNFLDENVKTKLTILVKSSTDHFDRRNVIRLTYGENNSELENFNLQTFFELGLPTNASTQVLIDDESNENWDILQGDFIDSYRNLTRKTIMGFEWATNNCLNTDFFLLVDDDVLVYPRNLLSTLNSYTKDDLLFMGDLDKNSTVIRDRKHSHFVSYEEYKKKKFPPVAFGGAILFSYRAFHDIFDVMPFIKFIWLEDVFIALAANATHINAIDNPKFFIRKSIKKVTKMQALHGIDNPEDFSKYWKLLAKTQTIFFKKKAKRKIFKRKNKKDKKKKVLRKKSKK